MTPELKSKWCKILRDPSTVQTHNRYFGFVAGSVCAFGGLMKAAGMGLAEVPRSFESFDTAPEWRRLHEKLGIHYNQARAVLTMNDLECKTLPEIADFVESPAWDQLADI